MIESFEIENFRLFDHLKVNRLGRVNLVVGKNNAGKSAFLEAVLLYHSKFSLRMIVALLENRQEDCDLKLSVEEPSLADPMRHFFKGHEIPKIEEGLSLSSSEGKLFLKSVAYVIQESKESDGSFVRKKKILASKDVADNSEVERGLLIKDENRSSTLIDLDGKIPSPIRLRKDFPEDTAQFILTRGITDEQASKMWDTVGLSDSVKDVVDGLKLIDPAIEQLAFIESEKEKSGRVPFTKVSCFNEPVPLKSLGDGMTRILHILLSLVTCKRRSLLVIDEFENGLHWSVQPKVWKMIFELAKRLDVQVFATTHSRDCIAGFHEAWQENESDGSFFRLSQEKGEPPVMEYDLHLLRGSLNSMVEVR